MRVIGTVLEVRDVPDDADAGDEVVGAMDPDLADFPL